jgi:chorismate dehydratase
LPTKFPVLSQKINVAAVSYLNTKPLLYGLRHSPVWDRLQLTVDYPARLAAQMQSGQIDMALLPVAAIPGIPGARIVSDFGIAADGNVASVAIFSHVPLNEVRQVYLDYQSRTSVRLARLLLQHHWKQDVEFLEADENYIGKIGGATAGVIIGDRALQHLGDFPYIYDLSLGWKEYTGLDFIFAAWVANRELPADFIADFNSANAAGLRHLDEVIAENPFPAYDLKTYYTDNIKFRLDDQKRRGLERFLGLIC